MKKKNKTLKTKLTERIAEMLGKPCPVELLKEIAPDLLTNAQPGDIMPIGADMLARKIMRLALDPARSNQWAVEMVYDRMEGKPVQGNPVTDQGRGIEETLDDITTQHLNSFAKQYAKDEADGRAKRGTAKERAAGPAGKLLGLPQNRPRRAQNADGESKLASRTA